MTSRQARDPITNGANPVDRWVAEQVGEIDLPHVVVVFDHQTGRWIAHGPFSDAVAALVVASQLDDDLKRVDDGVPFTVRSVPIHPVEG